MNKLYNSVDYNNLHFEYVGPTKDVSFYRYMDSKELFNAIKKFQIKFSDAKNLKNEFLNKLNDIKIGKKAIKQKKAINKITILEKKLLIFLETILRCYLMLITIQKIVKLREKDLRY